ncbi:hypothetical protein [Candidatus Amarolinea dominans]|uniref:hypothetical protein n=1 Tax=Candidatus Amarolinea dominans TaxID=3140696 RepID=UPI0031362CAB|nr:hypothetical protein [Anaerolineae bacterium]
MGQGQPTDVAVGPGGDIWGVEATNGILWHLAADAAIVKPLALTPAGTLDDRTWRRAAMAVCTPPILRAFGSSSWRRMARRSANLAWRATNRVSSANYWALPSVPRIRFLL